MATNKAVYVTKKGAMTLICEWAECEEVFTKMDDFLTHITEHIHAFVPKVIQPIDESTTVDDFVCEWRDCNYEMSGGFLELMRHVYFHGFHIKLKSIGLTMTIKKKLRGCTMDAGSRNVIPDLPERFHCAWRQCECVCDNAEYFYQHVRQHSDDYPQGRDLQVPAKCMWEGCEAVFSNRYKLMEHLRSHTQEKTVACPTCGSLFSSTTKFSDHLRRQDDLEVQSFQCSHCSKRFSTERLLRDHMRKHVNNFKCPFCEMTTPSPSTLRQHIRYRHSDERDFHCLHCDSSFKMNRDLERHMKMKHEKPSDYYCEHDGCTYKTRYEFQISKHMANKHNLKDPKYMCQICQSTYSRGRNLTRHLMKVHSFKWPPGHRRFRYKLGEDGNFHLQTVRYESYELSQQLQSERQRKALSGISVDGGRGGSKKSARQSKGQALTLDHMSTPAPLDVKGHTQGHAADQSVHKGHTDITNIENQESTAATKIPPASKRKASQNSKQRKKKRLCAQNTTDPNTTDVDISPVVPSAAKRTSARRKPSKSGADARTDDQIKQGGNSEEVFNEGAQLDTRISPGDHEVVRCSPGDTEEEDVNPGVPETLQIITETGEMLLIETNLPSEQNSPQHHIGIVTAENTPQGVLLSIQPQEEVKRVEDGAGMNEQGVGIDEKEVGIIGQGVGLNNTVTGSDREGVELTAQVVGYGGKGVELRKRESGLDEGETEESDNGVGLVIHEGESGAHGMGLAEAGEETGSVSHGLFYAVMNTALTGETSELILKSSEDQMTRVGPGGEGGGVMYDVQVPLGSGNVTIDLPALMGNRMEGAV